MMYTYFLKLNFFFSDAVVGDMSVSQHKNEKKKTIADS